MRYLLTILFCLATSAKAELDPIIWFGSYARALSGITGLQNAVGVAATPSYTFIGGTGTGMWAPTTTSLAFSTNGVEAARILSTGKFGVGTTNPTSMLSVGATSQFQVDSSGNIVKVNNVTSSFPASQGANHTMLHNDSAGNLSWSLADLTTDVSGILPFANGGTGNTAFTSGSIPYSNGTILTQDNANLFWDATNKAIGLGTTTPLHWESITAANGHTLQVFDSTNPARVVINADNSDPEIWMINGSNAANKRNFLLNVNANAELRLTQYSDNGGSGTQIMSWVNNGTTTGVGINTATPKTSLDVVGYSRVLGSAGVTSFVPSAGKGVEITYDTTADIGYFYSYNRDTAAYKETHVDGSLVAINADVAGNVGIGTATAPSLLTVASGSKFQVDSNGNVVKLNNVTTSFPASQGAANTTLHNDGSGNLTWALSTLTTDVTGVLPVANGGTGIASGTSGGIPYYSGTTTIASSGALTANAVVIGGGAGTTPAVVANNATGTNKFLTQSSSGAPAWNTVAAGDLPSGPTVSGLWSFGGGYKSTAQPNATLSLQTGISGPNQSTVLVKFDTVDFDQTTSYSTGTGLYTVPTTGRYLISAYVNLESVVVNNNISLWVKKNGSDFRALSNDFNPAGGITHRFGLSGSTILNLTAADTIGIDLMDDNVGATTIQAFQGNGYPFLSITMLN